MAPLTKFLTFLPIFASIHLSAAQSTITSAPDATATSEEGGQTIGAITGNNQQIGLDGTTYSCPGANVVDGTSSYCCVGGSVVVSTCPGWPICTGSATATGGVEGCITRVPYTQSDYSQAVSSAAMSITTGSGGDSTSGSGSSAPETGSSGNTMATSTSGSAKSSASSAASSASSAAAAAPTKIAMPLSFGVAGGLLGLVALL